MSEASLNISSRNNSRAGNRNSLKQPLGRLPRHQLQPHDSLEQASLYDESKLSSI